KRLIKNGKRIAHRPVPCLSEQSQSIVVSLELFPSDQIFQLPNNLLELHCAKTEVLATRADGLGNIFGGRSSQHENHMPSRLFQSLQKRVKCSVCNLMCLIQNVNLEPIACRTISRRLPQFADLINTAICRGIDLNHIH